MRFDQLLGSELSKKIDAADGSVVEMVILEASQQGAWPVRQLA